MAFPTTSALVSSVAFVGNNEGGAKMSAEATLFVTADCDNVLPIDDKFDIKRTLANIKIIASSFFKFSPSLKSTFRYNQFKGLCIIKR